MPARSIAVATIRFRPLSIPVRLLTTVGESKAPDLKLTSCMGRTMQRHVCTVCAAVLEQANDGHSRRPADLFALLGADSGSRHRRVVAGYRADTFLRLPTTR